MGPRPARDRSRPRTVRHRLLGATSVAFSPDGRTYALVENGDRPNGRAPALRVWDAATNAVRWTVPFALAGLVYSPDGKSLAGSCEDGSVRLWDTDRGREEHRFAAVGYPARLAFSKDGKLFVGASAEGAVKVWNVASGAEVHAWKTPAVTAVVVSPDGKVVALGHLDGEIGLWDLASAKQVRSLTGHSAHIQSLRFTPDGKTLVSSGNDGSIRLWNPEAQRARQIISLGPVNQRLAIDLDPSGKYLFAAGNCPAVFVLRLSDAAPLAQAADPDRTAAGADAKGFVPLFNGKDLTGWVTTNGAAPTWVVRDGYIEVAGNQAILTEKNVGLDFQLRAEFWLPLMADKKGQGRANSGIFLHGRYEIQILDSYMNDTFPDGTVGAMYRLVAPDPAALKKAVRKPETWNTFDITFHSPRIDAKGAVIEPGRLTVVLNDVTVVDDAKFDKVTAGAADNLMGTPGPILLQNHGDKVRFRKIEIKELPADPFQKGSVWVETDGAKKTLTVTERKGEQFKARFLLGGTIDREITGTVKDGKVSWLAKEVKVIQGVPGHDNEGTLIQEKDGDVLDFVFRPPGGAVAGTFKLRRKTAP